MVQFTGSMQQRISNIRMGSQKTSIKDDLVAQGVIKDGKVDFTNLYLGNYYVKEISPGEGYLLDETAYPVEVGYEGQDVAIVHRNVTVKETVKNRHLN